MRLFNWIGMGWESRSKVCSIHENIPRHIHLLSIFVIYIMVAFLIIFQLGVRMDVCAIYILAHLCEGPVHLYNRRLLLPMRILGSHYTSFFILNYQIFTSPSFKIILPDVSHLCLRSSLGSCLWKPVLSKQVIPSSLSLTFFYCFSLKGWSGYSLYSYQLPINDFLL
jgi:hypothetical protein